VYDAVKSTTQGPRRPRGPEDQGLLHPGGDAGLRPRALARVHEEVLARYYGCGLVVPALLEGARVLDLGCGPGATATCSPDRGEAGRVVGVDMTEAQLAVARRHVDEHTRRFGYREPNVRFLPGYLERLDELDLAPASVDVIVSNCVINLSRTSARCSPRPTAC